MAAQGLFSNMWDKYGPGSYGQAVDTRLAQPMTQTAQPLTQTAQPMTATAQPTAEAVRQAMASRGIQYTDPNSPEGAQALRALGIQPMGQSTAQPSPSAYQQAVDWFMRRRR